MKLTDRQAIVDRQQGYPIYRSWYPEKTAAEVYEQFHPDVVIILAHKTGLMAEAFAGIGAKILFSFQDVEFAEHGFDLTHLEKIHGVANSRFTADAYTKQFAAHTTVIHPFIDRSEYLVKEIGEKVTFINPDPVKGRDVVLAVAALLPEIQFRVQEAWPMSLQDRELLVSRIADLPNVRLYGPVKDMREVYRDTRILLCPSQWEEGYGRIASEAQFSGIPVVGSNRGGLPEAIGDGGIIIPAEAPANEWAEAIRTIWSSPYEFEKLQIKALSHSAREELCFERQLIQWETAIQGVLE